jgi:hypothetical protein
VGRVLHMLPFFGLALGMYFFLSLDMSVAGAVALVALVQSALYVLYILVQIFYHGWDGLLEAHMELRSVLIPLLFFLMCSISFLYTVYYGDLN